MRKIFNKNVRELHPRELWEKLSEFGYTPEEIAGVKITCAFLIENDFIIGAYFERPQNFYIAFTAENENTKEKTYARTKVRIIKKFIKILLYPVISSVDISDDEANRFNKLIFPYQMKMKLEGLQEEQKIYCNNKNFFYNMKHKYEQNHKEA